MSEEWRDVPGYGGRYQASNLGAVRSVNWFDNMANGRRRFRVGRNISPSRASRYQTVSLYAPDGKRNSPSVHSVIALTFFGPRPEGMVVCHNDGNRCNNALENLRYDTQSNNVMDAIAHGTHPEASRTHCLRGHEFTEANTALLNGGKSRRCKKCANMYGKINRAIKRDARLNPQEKAVIEELRRERETATMTAGSNT